MLWRLLSIEMDSGRLFWEGEYHTVFVGINYLHHSLLLLCFPLQDINIIWIKIHVEGIVNMEGY